MPGHALLGLLLIALFVFVYLFPEKWMGAENLTIADGPRKVRRMRYVALLGMLFGVAYFLNGLIYRIQ